MDTITKYLNTGIDFGGRPVASATALPAAMYSRGQCGRLTSGCDQVRVGSRWQTENAQD